MPTPVGPSAEKFQKTQLAADDKIDGISIQIQDGHQQQRQMVVTALAERMQQMHLAAGDRFGANAHQLRESKQQQGHVAATADAAARSLQEALQATDACARNREGATQRNQKQLEDLLKITMGL